MSYYRQKFSRLSPLADRRAWPRLTGLLDCGVTTSYLVIEHPHALLDTCSQERTKGDSTLWKCHCLHISSGPWYIPSALNPDLSGHRYYLLALKAFPKFWKQSVPPNVPLWTSSPCFPPPNWLLLSFYSATSVEDSPFTTHRCPDASSFSYGPFFDQTPLLMSSHAHISV